MRRALAIAAVGHRRGDGNGGRARSDDDHAFSRIVEMLGPELRMDDLPLEILTAGELGVVRRVIIIIARSLIKETGADDGAAAIRALGGDGPQRVGAAPVGGQDLAIEPDMRADAALIDDMVKIVEDRRAVGDRLLMPPRFEHKPQRMHVAVRPDAGITEQIPCAPQLRAPFDDGKAATGAFLLQMRRHADARNPGPDDQDIDVSAALFRSITAVRLPARDRANRIHHRLSLHPLERRA
jgi:hypothetical protein